MTYDNLERADDEAMQDAKKAFGDFVIGLEQKLDMAEEYGMAGDIRMLAVLRELTDAKSDLEMLAKTANEEMPLRDYHVEVTNMLHQYLISIISHEYDLIADLQDGDITRASRINQLMNIIDFYADLYPELELGVWREKVGQLSH